MRHHNHKNPSDCHQTDYRLFSALYSVAFFRGEADMKKGFSEEQIIGIWRDKARCG